MDLFHIFTPVKLKGDLLMDGHSLLEMKSSELAGQVGTVFQDPRSQLFYDRYHTRIGVRL